MLEQAITDIQNAQLFVKGQQLQIDQQAAQVQRQAATIAELTSERHFNIEKLFIVGGAFAYINIPYLFGAEYENNKAFDCSSFVRTVFGTIGVKLPRTSREQLATGQVIQLIQDAKRGDLVGFVKKNETVISHVGIYDGNGGMLQTNKAGLPIRIVLLKDFDLKLVAIRRVY